MGRAVLLKSTYQPAPVNIDAIWRANAIDSCEPENAVIRIFIPDGIFRSCETAACIEFGEMMRCGGAGFSEFTVIGALLSLPIDMLTPEPV